MVVAGYLNNGNIQQGDYKMEQKQLTDSEKLDLLNKRIKRMEASQHIQTAIVIIGFLGIISWASLVSKVKNGIK